MIALLLALGLRALVRRRAALAAVLAWVAASGCAGDEQQRGHPTRGRAQATVTEPGYYRLLGSYGVDPQPCVYSGNDSLCYRNGLERFPHAYGVHRLIRRSSYGSRLVGPDGQDTAPFHAEGGGARNNLWLPDADRQGNPLHERLSGFSRPVNFLPTTEHGDKYVVVLHEAHPRVVLVERDGDRDTIVGVMPAVLGRKTHPSYERGEAAAERHSWTPDGEAEIYRMVISRNMTPMRGGAWELPGVGFDMYIRPRDGGDLAGPKDYYGVALHAAWWWYWGEDAEGQVRASTRPLDTQPAPTRKPHQLDAWNDVTYASHGCINLPDKSWHGINLRRLHGDDVEGIEQVSAAELLFKWTLSGISGDRHTVDADASPTAVSCHFPRASLPAAGVDDCALSQPLPVFIARDLDHLATMRHPASGRWPALIAQLRALDSRGLLWNDGVGGLLPVADTTEITSHEGA